MKYYSIIFLGSMIMLSCSSQNTDRPNTKGKIVFDKLNDRELQIYLPPGYNDANTYPVIYFHDGQNIFDTATAYAAEWQIDEIMDSLIAIKKIEPLIVVGIYNSPKRAEEYVPFTDPYIMEMMNMENWNGGLHLIFADFIIYELLPYIEEKYKASNQRMDRAIFGSSLGGLNALWLGLDYSNEFSFIGAISPSVWVGGGAILRDMEIIDSIPDDKVWIDQGELEWDPQNLTLVKNLEEQGMEYGKNLWYYEHTGAQHNELSWSQRISYPFLLFKGTNLDDTYNLFAEVLRPKRNSDSQEKTLPRINAQLIRKDGIRYSLLDKATYKSENANLSILGNIEKIRDGRAEINIAYKDLQFVIQYKE